MKKTLLLAAVMTISTAALGQNWLYSEISEIVGIEDMNVGLEKVKANAKEALKKSNSKDPLANAMAMKILESNYKKEFKRMQEERYIKDYPDGTFSIYGKLDIPNDRSVFFCPQVGRVILQDYKNRVQYIVFPKLEMYLQTDIDKSVASAVKTYMTVMPIPEFARDKLISDYNGFRALGQVSLLPATEASIPENVITYNGNKYEMIPLPGHLLVKPGDTEYWGAIYVEAPISTGVYEGSKQLVQWEEGDVDPANYELPKGLERAKDIKALNKIVQKAISNGTIGVEDPGYNKELFWDCFK